MTLILLMVLRGGGKKKENLKTKHHHFYSSMPEIDLLSSPEPETDLLFSGVSFIIGIYPSEISGNGFSISELVHGTLSREGLDLS